MINMLTGDFETFYDKDYTLKKMGTLDYVRDARFHAHGIALKHNAEPTFWVTHDAIEEYFASVNWDETIFIAHNTYFDGLILTQKYNIPYNKVIWGDTLSMARAIFPHGMAIDLDSVDKTLGGTGKTEGLEATKNKRHLTDEEEANLAAYAINDVDKCYDVFMKLWRALPWSEHNLLHLTIRMGVEPVLLIDRPLAQAAFTEADAKRATLIKASNIAATVLASNQQFAALLVTMGIEVPMKVSPANGKDTFAFSKSDIGFKNLFADYPEHNDIWQARLAVKSTIEKSRAQRFMDIHDSGNGTLPMPLKFWGAHTSRWSGMDKINVQNLPRAIWGDPNSGKLRRSILAPEGYVIIVVDSSQIELRINMWFAGLLEFLEVLRAGGDIYAFAATKHYGYECTKKGTPNERQFGKMLELALGFGMGHLKFRTQSALGFMGCPPVVMSTAESFQTVHAWRGTHKAIMDQHKWLNNRIPSLLSPNYHEDYKCIQMQHGGILMPNDTVLQYTGLQAEEDGWTYGVGKKRKKVYGGLMDENIVQMLARIFIGEKMATIDAETAAHLVSGTHDEPIAICREEDAPQALEEMMEIMRIPPTWAPDLPVDAEGGYAREYSK